jgi:DUF4097 and DUF4098 domain-containing protein YvlB
MGKVKFLSLIAPVFLASLLAQAAEQSSITRSNPERQGRAWVQRVEAAAPVREGGRLLLRADFGSVVIKTGASDRMECRLLLRAYTANEAEARRYFANYDLGVRALENGAVYINGKLGGERQRSVSLGAEFEIKVPQRFNLDLETQGGDISVENALQGELRATTAGGDIRTADLSGPLRAETAGGNITLGDIGQRVDARTAGGSIRIGSVKGETTLETSGGEVIVGQIDGNLRAETAGGDVVIAGATGQIDAETAGGQIQIGETGGNVRAQTAGGSIRLQGARGRVVAETAGGSIDLFQLLGAVRASTAAGRILAQIVANKKTFGSSALETSMGDVYVYLPVDLPLNIDAAIDDAGGHQIVSDFPLTILGDKEEFMARSISGRGALNGGGETLRIRTVAGNIEIHKLDSRTLEQLKARQDAELKAWQERREAREQKHREREERQRARQQEPD